MPDSQNTMKDKKCQNSAQTDNWDDIIQRPPMPSSEKIPQYTDHGAVSYTHLVGENMASRRSLERSGFFLQEKIPVADLPSGLYRYRLEWGKEKGNVL